MLTPTFINTRIKCAKKKAEKDESMKEAWAFLLFDSEDYHFRRFEVAFLGRESTISNLWIWARIPR